MQQIEATVGEHHAATVAFVAAKPQNRLLQCEDRIQKVSMRALPEQIVKPEVVVITRVRCCAQHKARRSELVSGYPTYRG